MFSLFAQYAMTLGIDVLKLLPQVHGAGCSQQRQVRFVSTRNSLSNTRTNSWLNLDQANRIEEN